MPKHSKIVEITVDDENDVTFFFDDPMHTPFNAREFNQDSGTGMILRAITALITTFNNRGED